MKRARMAKLGVAAAPFALRSSDGRAPSDGAAILRLAAEAGLKFVDTPADYGAAEALAGAPAPALAGFRVVTKAQPVQAGVDSVEAAARGFLARMGLERADAIVVSEPADLLGPQGDALWSRLNRLKDEGLFARVGLAASAEDDPVGLARRFGPDVMQLPTSLLDQRLVRDGALGDIAALGAEVQLRSVFLQGLLFQSSDGLPAHLVDAAPRLSRLRRLIAEAGADPMQAALAFALERPEASAVIVGVRSAAELRAVMAAAAAPPPRLDWASLAVDAGLRPQAAAAA